MGEWNLHNYFRDQYFFPFTFAALGLVAGLFGLKGSVKVSLVILNMIGLSLSPFYYLWESLVFNNLKNQIPVKVLIMGDLHRKSKKSNG
ncbi:hypothetical protein VKA52_14490 [Halobacillus sp. HZG1]|uniref:hypothetical protein n=1 Tax=Halobacillus sp. HZG1 TaxID=3111769 RepID=UPI002DBD9609|nr:hypothetical protein [Halobacillus sp. HZG1]MEC3884941.1 hypothetical protein [Halobacillus sp. HZG1]